MSLFSKNLRFLRKKKGMNQDEISVLFDKKPNTVGNWENKKSEPSLAELMKLSEFFQVNLQELLNTDLEGVSSQEEQTLNTGSPTVEKTNLAAAPVVEGSQDAFWLIMREIRALNDKVDLLVSSLESTGPKRNSDKSYH
jgi:transcriptional regulator with XRE-family HTH domain